jgi:phosphoglycerate dehydrogenase-like enzyme
LRRKAQKPKILYLDLKAPTKPESFKVVHNEFSNGFEVIQASSLSEDAFQTLLGECEFMIATTDKVSTDMIQKGARLKMIHKWGAGYDSIDIKAAAERGISVARTTGSNSIAVAEHAILLILALYRQLIDTVNELKSGQWLKGTRRLTNFELRGKKVGIIGFGNIGKAVARRLKGFETQTFYFSRFDQSLEIKKELGVEGPLPLEQLIEKSDIITLHCLFNEETKHLMNADRLKSMKKSAILINTARGKVVDEKALYKALKNKDIAGAGLDVFENEPLDPDNPLLKLPNVVVTPHVAAHSYDTFRLTANRVYQNIKRMAEGLAVDDRFLVKL